MSRLCVDKQIRIFAVTKKAWKTCLIGLIQACMQSVCGKLKGNASIQVKLPSNPQFGESLPHSFWAIVRPAFPREKKSFACHIKQSWQLGLQTKLRVNVLL
jgi:hypothetical protein